VGRFAPEKGVDLLWRAAARAGLPLQLAGDHREYRPPFARAENRFHGALGGDDLERFFQGARLLVVPSLWFETYGMVVAEAMMRGVPVLCSDIGALSEMVEDGRTGRLFPPGDEDALVRRLGEMWSDAAALARLSDAARERARDFGPGPYFDRIETLYREAMALP
jgi:glycosyltransferase involved in cell wall biosynthesis